MGDVMKQLLTPATCNGPKLTKKNHDKQWYTMMNKYLLYHKANTMLQLIDKMQMLCTNNLSVPIVPLSCN